MYTLSVRATAEQSRDHHGRSSPKHCGMTTRGSEYPLNLASHLQRGVVRALRREYGKPVCDAVTKAVLDLTPSIWDTINVPGVKALDQTMSATVTGCKSGSQPLEFSLAIAPTVRVPFNFVSRTLRSYGSPNEFHGPLYPSQIGVKVTCEGETFTARLDQGAILSVQLHSCLRQDLFTNSASYKDHKRVMRAVMAMADDIGTEIRKLNPDRNIDDFSGTRFKITASRLPDGDNDVSYSVNIEPRIGDFIAGEVHCLSPVSRQVSTSRPSGETDSSEDSASSSSEDEAA